MRPLQHEPETLLMERVRLGDVQAFEEIYRRYWSVLYAQAYRRLQNRESTEELIQDFFTDLWARREKIAIESSVQAYFRSAVKYLVLHFLQREEVRRNYLLAAVPEPSTSDTEDQVALRELETWLHRHVENLSPQSRKVFELSRDQHLTIPEIASMLGISEKTAENHLGRALKTLRIQMKDFAVLALFLLFE
ncbi:RNA polymerase sigma-70 factor [Siphonobacter aquaeclarae]|uniref:RNA polymerase sigma-70 factor, ECF subfamily n=1 Tax=Siphonobacter aquaeclarae TaxID=563176 RepID=A0A1G9NJB9_9BACT|nr:RNA polymerase sigma-70 factor [Siphonobacter aquaeclarae]SDL86460.1 RNA polymerase sigma-70 factor, ECF subfamily [Siphonobacter aquaeclarae]